VTVLNAPFVQPSKANPLINQIMSVRTVWRFRSTVHSMEKEKLLLGDLLRQAPSLIVPG
jgi:hypothetical protein